MRSSPHPIDPASNRACSGSAGAPARSMAMLATAWPARADATMEARESALRPEDCRQRAPVGVEERAVGEDSFGVAWSEALGADGQEARTLL